MITDSLLDRIVSYLETDITHIGLGTGSAPIVSDTSLASETERKAATSFIDDTTLVCEGFWDETEANGVTYTNAGVFGNGATSTIGTGELFAGGALNAEKDNTQTLTVSIEITVEAVN